MMKERMKRIVSIFLILTLMVSLFSGIEFISKASEVSFREYTFTDLGISDQEVIGTSVSGTLPDGLTSWDGVALTGYITFPEGAAVGSDNITFGGNWLLGPNGSGDTLAIFNGIIPKWDWSLVGLTSVTTTGTRLKVRFEFSVDVANSANYSVDIYINDLLLGDNVPATDGVAHMSTSLTFNASAGKAVKVESIQKESGYREYTFTDLGISDQDVSGGNVSGTLPEDATNWDKVAITGYLTFPSNADFNAEDRLIIGGQYLVGLISDSQFGVLQLPGEWKGFPTASEQLRGNEMKLRLEFDMNDTDYVMKLIINDTVLQDNLVITNGVSEMNMTFAVNASVGKTITIKSLANGDVDEDDTAEEITYTEYALEDLGIEAQNLSGGSVVGVLPEQSTDWDKIAIVGTVTFPYDADFNAEDRFIIGGQYLIGPLSDSQFGVLQLPGTWQGFPSSTELIRGNEIEFRLEFLKNMTNESDYIMKLIVNNHVLQEDLVITDGVSLLDRTFAINASAGKTITIGTPPAEEPIEQMTPQALGYSQIRLGDFELADGVYSPEHKNGNWHFDIHSDGKTLNNTYLDVNIVFGHEETMTKGTSLRYGSEDGWLGVQIGTESGLLFVVDALTGSGAQYTLEDLGLNSFSETFNLKLGISHSEPGQDGKADVIYDLWINDIRVAAKVLLPSVSGIGNGLSIYTPDGSLTLTSPASIYGDGGTDSVEQLDASFRQLTFHSFKIEDGVYKNVNNICATGTYPISLDKSVFSGEVYFSNEKGGDFRYGGKTNEWCGLWFYSMPDGRIYMRGVEGDTGTYVFKPFVAGVELTDNWVNIKISMEFVDSDGDDMKDDVKLGVWFEDVLYDNQYIYLKDYVQYIGDKLSIYVDKSDNAFIMVKSDTRVRKGIDFTLYGFTVKWKKELGIL